MKFIKNKFILILLSVFSACAVVFAGCNSAVCVTSIEKTGSEGLNDIYTVYYSDGTTSSITVKNGSDGSDGDDGKDVSVDDLYEKYVELYGEISYSEFIDRYLTTPADSSLSVAKNLQSAMVLYTEFVETSVYYNFFSRPVYTSNTAIYTGSAVIWEIDGEYAYIVTNYHVVFDGSADESKNGGSKIARKIYAYLYGSGGSPVKTDTTDENGYNVYDYGNYAVECEFIGGSINYDIAVLRAEISAFDAVNSEIRAVTAADGYCVGQTAYTIGNPEGNGISVTQGIVCVDNEYIALAIDDKTRYYRSIRIDTALYGGNSGGGLFNSEGKLIGISNAGEKSNENINYAIPVQIVKGAVENVLYYYRDGDDGTSGIYKFDTGITTASKNSKYVYDEVTGYGKICEDVVAESVSAGGIASSLSIAQGDIIKALTVNGAEYAINRSFDIDDLSLLVREGDVISFTVQRNGERITTESYVLKASDFASA